LANLGTVLAFQEGLCIMGLVQGR